MMGKGRVGAISLDMANYDESPDEKEPALGLLLNFHQDCFEILEYNEGHTQYLSTPS